jgi:hypothetical protein
MSPSRVTGLFVVLCVLGAVTAALVGLGVPRWVLVSWAFLVTGFLVGALIGPPKGEK